MNGGLEVRDLRVRVAGRSLLEVDRLDVGAATLATVLGGAGSGKTVMAAALGGGLASSGRVTVAGTAVGGPPSRRVRAGLAVQVRDGSRLAGATVAEVLGLADRDRAATALERLPQLATRRHIPAQLLSGGEQQLLQVACAWCVDPAVLVLDSPTVGLAPDAAASIVAMALDCATAGAAVLWLEQDPRAAPGEVAALLAGGRLVSPAASGLAGPGGPGRGTAGPIP